jgi:hypothetical protein
MPGPNDAFDERRFADETHDDDDSGREDDDDCDQAELRDREVQEAAAAALVRISNVEACNADEEPEQPERSASAGVVERLSDDLAYGHARLPVSGREGHSLG